MKLKKATLLAIIGSALSSIVGLYYMLLSFQIMKYSEGIGKVMNTLQGIGSMCLLIFFITLYSNQKKQ